MKKKTVSFFLFGLLTLLLVSISVTLYVIDWNKYRDTLASLATDRLGVRVELAGDLSLGFLPRPTVSARLVRLTPGQAGFNDAIATADRIDMHLGLTALMTGSLELQSLAFDGLTASLLETDEGWTIEGWPTGDGEAGAPTLLSLDRFRINSGTINVRPLAGETVSLEGLDLSLAGRLPMGPLDWDGSAVVAGRNVVVSGRVAPTRSEEATSLKATVSVEDNTLEFSGRVKPDGAVRGRFQASGRDINTPLDFLEAAFGATAAPALPALAFDLDLQVDRDSRGVSRLISRRASLGNTRGTLDLTLADNAEKLHVTGTASLGAVPLDTWLADLAGPAAENSADDAPAASPLTGSIDISVEAVELRGRQIQQVATSLRFSDTGMQVSEFSALLPGASRFSYVGQDASGGTVQFQSGGLQEILGWAGVETSSAVPAGRLTTANLRGRLNLTETAWILSELTGAIDTSTLLAEVSGSIQPFALGEIIASVDTLNLDAYWPDPEFQGGGEPVPALPPVAFQLDAEKLHWLGQNFTGVRFAGSVGNDAIAVSDVQARHFDGDISGSFAAQFSEDRALQDLAVSLTYSDWRFPVLESLAPDAGLLLSNFTGNRPASGGLEANGPASALQSRVTLNSDAASFDFAGAIDVSAMRGRLQGSLSLRNVADMTHRMGIWKAADGHLLPISSNLTIDGARERFSYTATGDFAASQFSASGDYSSTGITLVASISAGPDQQTGLDAVVQQAGLPVDTSQPRRARFSLVSGEENWSLSDIDIRNGNMAIAGNLQRGAEAISGGLIVQEFDMSTLAANNDNQGREMNVPPGAVSLDLRNIRWFGQRLTAPAAGLNADGETATFTLGDGATLNENPISVDLSFQERSGLVAAKLDAASVDIARLAQAVGASGAFSGSAAAQLDLTANLKAESSLVSTLSGQGRFEGGAGSLYFMAVPELISTIQNGDSAASFLGGIGSLLRSGTTDFARIEGSFQIDSGVALVDAIVAEGDWGQLELDGQVNIPDDYINMSGELALARPQDAPVLPVVYEGALSAPNVRWTSRALERFAIAGIERRLRTRLFGELEQAQGGEGAPPNPGAVVSELAAGLLARLKARQEEKRRAAEEGKNPNETDSQGTEGQRP